MTDEQKPEVQELQTIPPEVFEAIMKDIASKTEIAKTEGIEKSILKALGDIKNRSFSGRNAQLGKMFNCKVCMRRHRASQVCTQKFKYLHTEEEVDTGIKTDVFAEFTVGRSMVAGKRRRQRPNHGHLEVVEIAKDIYGRENEYDRNNPAHRSMLDSVRVEAVREWKRRRRVAAKRKRQQQDVSRRINRGLLQGGFRP